MVKIGQRWRWVGQTDVVEIIEEPVKLFDGYSAICIVLQSSHKNFPVGFKRIFYCFPIDKIGNNHWSYLDGQDKPL